MEKNWNKIPVNKLPLVVNGEELHLLLVTHVLRVVIHGLFRVCKVTCILLSPDRGGKIAVIILNHSGQSYDWNFLLLIFYDSKTSFIAGSDYTNLQHLGIRQ
jgi:1-acyl-sn-glycerol-3-phosphate acyltransferase